MRLYITLLIQHAKGARCSSVVRAVAHGAMGRRIDPSWGGVTKDVVYIIMSVG